jgi:3-deoxy-D-manno-octulosonate 8-phosphate phosphatase (KDO 8-P phosphatase)
VSSAQRVSRSLAEAAGKIRLLIVDVDGVLTDGSIILDNEGNEYKSFHVRDGHGIKMLIRAGIGVAIITGRFSKVVKRRARELGITELHQKCRDKRAVYRSIAKKYSLSDAEIAYMGDDIIDAPVMAMAGLPIAVKDADEEVKKYARHVTKNRGGRGAVREVSDLILKSKGLWKRIVDEYFET